MMTNPAWMGWCEKCDNFKSTEGGKTYRKRLLRCKECRAGMPIESLIGPKVCKDCKHYDPKIYVHEASCTLLKIRCQQARDFLGKCKREGVLFEAIV